MPSYGAFCTEFHTLHKKHIKPHAAREKHAKKAHAKWRAARATQHTTQTSYQIPLAECSTSTQCLRGCTRGLQPLATLCIGSEKYHDLQSSSMTLPTTPFRSWTKSVPISKSYDQNNFASFYYLKMHQQNQSMLKLFGGR